MSGHKDPSKGRVLLLLLVVSLVGTGILYFDARSIELELESKVKEIKTLTKKVETLDSDIALMKRDGVPTPAQLAKMQEQTTLIFELKAQISHLDNQLEQCVARDDIHNTPPPAKPNSSLLDRLNKIGKN